MLDLWTDPHRRAWTVIVASAVITLAICAATPFLGWRFIQQSTRNNKSTIALTSGRVLVKQADSVLPVAIGNDEEQFEEGIDIQVEENSQAALSIREPRQDELLSTFQLYSDTDAQIRRSRTPRFALSQSTNYIDIVVTRGRMRITIAESDPTTIIDIETPDANITLRESGSYSIEVRNGITDVLVANGEALVYASGTSLELDTSERTVVQQGSKPEGILRSERNLLRNGDFSESIVEGWSVYKNRDDVDQSDGAIVVSKQDGLPAIQFNRRGAGWAQTGITQELNRDIRDYSSLKLTLAVWLAFQDLRNCGIRGSECPLMVRIEYVDGLGNQQSWVHGFYYLQDSSNTYPTHCVTCPPPSGQHDAINNGVWHFYDSQNLVEQLTLNGTPPASIESISIYAEGHSFESYATAIELVVEE